MENVMETFLYEIILCITGYKMVKCCPVPCINGEPKFYITFSLPLHRFSEALRVAIVDLLIAESSLGLHSALIPHSRRLT